MRFLWVVLFHSGPICYHLVFFWGVGMGGGAGRYSHSVSFLEMLAITVIIFSGCLHNLFHQASLLFLHQTQETVLVFENADKLQKMWGGLSQALSQHALLTEGVAGSKVKQASVETTRKPVSAFCKHPYVYDWCSLRCTLLLAWVRDHFLIRTLHSSSLQSLPALPGEGADGDGVMRK